MEIIGIAGGSGSGKSSVSYALQDAFPDKIEVLNLDDYQKLKDEPNLPIVNGMINWDHPKIVNWEFLINDVKKLQNEETLIINTWAHRSNPNYIKTGQMIPRTIKPKPVLIIEGYLALYSAELNKFYTKKYYLELEEIKRIQRRNKSSLTGQDKYQEKVLTPMFRQFVEPTKTNADETINVTAKTVEEIKTYLIGQLF